MIYDSARFRLLPNEGEYLHRRDEKACYAWLHYLAGDDTEMTFGEMRQVLIEDKFCDSVEQAENILLRLILRQAFYVRDRTTMIKGDFQDGVETHSQ